MFHNLLKELAGIFFNIFNKLLAGNLPPFGCIYILVEEQGHYLTIKSPNGQFIFPGGFIRWHENPAQAALREGKEETGLDLRIGDVLGYYSDPSSRFNSMSVLSIIFHAEVVGGELHHSIEGQPFWLDEIEVRTKMSPLSQRILDDYLQHSSNYARLIVPGSERYPVTRG